MGVIDHYFSTEYSIVQEKNEILFFSRNKQIKKHDVKQKNTLIFIDTFEE